MKWLVRKIKRLFRVKKPSRSIPDRAQDVSRNIDSGDMYEKAMFIPDLPKLKTNAKMREDIYIIHHTAGHHKQKAIDFMRDFLKRKLCTDFMDYKGKIYIQRDHDRAGSHIGKAKKNGRKMWTKGIGGIEIASPGILTHKNGKFFTWFNKEVHHNEVRKVTKAQGYNCDGYFKMLTKEQESELANYLIYLKRRHPKMEFLNHSDVAGYRGKTDLDGSLSMPLKEFVKEKVLPLV